MIEIDEGIKKFIGDFNGTEIISVSADSNFFPNTKFVKNSNGNVSEDVRLFIENEWEKKTKINSNLFNGNLVEIKELDASCNNIIFSEMDYKSFITACNEDFFNIFGSDNIKIPITVTPMIITTDNKLIMGNRKNTNFIQFPGGMVDFDKDIVDGCISFINCAQREINEELYPIYTYDYKYLGISINKKQLFVTVYTVCKTDKSFGEIDKDRKLNKEQVVDYDEIPNVFALDIFKKNILAYMKDNKNILVGSAYVGLELFIDYYFK